jgi:hypothetical protein
VSSGVSYRVLQAKVPASPDLCRCITCSSKTQKQIHFLMVPVVPNVWKNRSGGRNPEKRRRRDARFAQNADLNGKCVKMVSLLEDPLYTVIFCCLRCSAKASLEIARTRSKPSRPLAAFLLNLSTVTSSMLFLIFCHPPHIAMTLAVWSKIVLPGVLPGVYRTVSCTDKSSLHVRF